MGSDDDGKQELDARLLQKAELGEVIRDPALARTSEEQITVADQTGVAVQDIQIAKFRAPDQPRRNA